jgi:hypothetical protein
MAFSRVFNASALHFQVQVNACLQGASQVWLQLDELIMAH